MGLYNLSSATLRYLLKSSSQVWDETMDGNDDAFVDTPKAGIHLVLSHPQLLYFDTNWWEEQYQGIVALKLQGIVLYHNNIYSIILTIFHISLSKRRTCRYLYTS